MTTPLTSQQRRAFLPAPDPSRYYAAGAIEEARQRIVRTIARHEGPALVVGAVGTGKSLLMAVLAAQYEPRMSVVTLPGAQICTRRALLQMILAELHLPYRHMDEGELRLSILEHLRNAPASQPTLREPSPLGRGQGEGSPRTCASAAAAPPPRRLLLLVDEAESLPTRLLEELRALTNIVHHGLPLVSLVLAGSPILEERLAEPQLEKFSQRIGARCYLAPLTRDETFQFVRSQVSAAGVKPEKWFDASALDAVYAATGGVPRLVNQLGDQLVWLIEESGCAPLDAALVQQAWSDLQQLPAPWNTDAHSSLSSPAAASVGPMHTASPGVNVIEFGDLDDDVTLALDSPSAQNASRGVYPPGPPAPQAHEEAIELFRNGPAVPKPAPHELDDDLPASIPIGMGRTRRNADLGQFSAAILATEHLVDQLDEFDALELAELEAEPEPVPATRAAEDPFAEPFAEEEILVDPYSSFETHLLRSARQVTNRVDRTFAAELARCEQRREARKSAPLEAPVPTGPPVPPTPPPCPATKLPLGPVSAPLILETPRPAVTPVPGRQFRRLFSSLEAAAPARTRQG